MTKSIYHVKYQTFWAVFGNQLELSAFADPLIISDVLLKKENCECGETSVCSTATMKLCIFPLVLMKIKIVFCLKINNQPWHLEGSQFQLTLLFPTVNKITIDFHYMEECLFYDK